MCLSTVLRLLHFKCFHFFHFACFCFCTISNSLFFTNYLPHINKAWEQQQTVFYCHIKKRYYLFLASSKNVDFFQNVEEKSANSDINLRVQAFSVQSSDFLSRSVQRNKGFISVKCQRFSTFNHISLSFSKKFNFPAIFETKWNKILTSGPYFKFFSF